MKIIFLILLGVFQIKMVMNLLKGKKIMSNISLKHEDERKRIKNDGKDKSYIL